MKKETYGALRAKDVATLGSVVRLFKSRHFECGLHGTSLWNSKYRDIDLLVFTPNKKDRAEDFIKTVDLLKTKFAAKILKSGGNKIIGLDYDIAIKRAMLHISYVVLL